MRHSVLLGPTKRLGRILLLGFCGLVPFMACVTAAKSPAVAPSHEALIHDRDAPEGRTVLARLDAIEYRTYTDHLVDGSVLVSDMIHFSVVEPEELASLSVKAYYQGLPEVAGRRLEVGDLLWFQLPSAPQRDGIFFEDLKELRHSH